MPVKRLGNLSICCELVSVAKIQLWVKFLSNKVRTTKDISDVNWEQNRAFFKYDVSEKDDTVIVICACSLCAHNHENVEIRKN
jgi:hypothetical protein